MQQYYDLKKKGTVVLSAGRAGSHLLADMLYTNLKPVTPVDSLGEVFFKNVTTPVTLSVGEMLHKIKTLDSVSKYVILQVQDFVSQVQILKFASDWLQNYHVIYLTRDNIMAQFFGLQILQNFHNVVPVHTIKGIDDSFNPLKNKKITVARDTVYQFFAHTEILKLFKYDVATTYENIIQESTISQSRYQKNQYPVGPQELFENYDQVVEWLYGQD